MYKLSAPDLLIKESLKNCKKYKKIDYGNSSEKKSFMKGALMNGKKTDFPFFTHHQNSIYLDNAATTHKPQQVLDALNQFYTTVNANMHRGIYQLAETATAQFEATRVQVAHFLSAADPIEIIFTHGATAGINMVAHGWGNECIQEGDEVVVTELEHHSNFVPWQQLCIRKKAIFKIIPVTPQGLLDLSNIDEIITSKTKMVAVTQVSNAIGTQVDLEKIITRAKKVGSRVLVDGCQAVPYHSVDVKKIDCDFYVFSGHKIMGPTGVGVLYARKNVHAEFIPPFTGGGMVLQVSSEKTTFLKAPRCYEAGTPPAAQVLGLSAALSYWKTHLAKGILDHVALLTALTIEGLQKMPYVRLLGPIDQLKKSGHLVSFVVDGMHAHDVAAYLDQYGICVRAGHHCAQPLARALGYEASVRVSFYSYTSVEDVMFFLKVLETLHS